MASEVKALANQTAQATSEIAEQIQEMQTATEHAVSSMEQVSEVIANVEQTSTVIASAMEEQGAATQEIAHNVQEAAGGTQTVSENVTGLTNASHGSGTGSRSGHVGNGQSCSNNPRPSGTKFQTSSTSCGRAMLTADAATMTITTDRSGARTKVALPRERRGGTGSVAAELADGPEGKARQTT